MPLWFVEHRESPSSREDHHPHPGTPRGKSSVYRIHPSTFSNKIRKCSYLVACLSSWLPLDRSSETLPVMSAESFTQDQREFRARNADLLPRAERRLKELGERAISPVETLLLYNAGVLRTSAEEKAETGK
jgi:hypothetical protein